MDMFYCLSVLAQIKAVACGVKGLLLVNPEMIVGGWLFGAEERKSENKISLFRLRIPLKIISSSYDGVFHFTLNW